MPSEMVSADEAIGCDMHRRRRMDAGQASLHYLTESNGSKRDPRVWVTLDSTAFGPENERFGAEVLPGRIAGDRTRAGSLAPKLKAEGKRV